MNDEPAGSDERPPSNSGSQQSGNDDNSPISPVFWAQSHQRTFSNISVESIAPGGITLRDNTDGDSDSKNKACWAKSVHIEDHVVVNGSRTGIGAFVVWNIKVETLHVGR
jgi:hypothetical protein